MAAATVGKQRDLRSDPWFIREVEMSVLTSDQTENVANGSPTTATGVGISPELVTWEVITPPTVLCVFQMYRVVASDVTASSPTCALKFVAEQGGDLVGAVVKVRFHFMEFKVGGIDAGATA